jgi:hypothetical protein
VADVLFDLLRSLHVDPGNGSPALRRPEQAAQRADCRRLADPFGPSSQNFSAVDPQREMLDGGEGAV